MISPSSPTPEEVQTDAYADLAVLVSKLAFARTRKAQLREALDAMRREIEATREWQMLSDQLKETLDACDLLDAQVRTEAVRLYEATGNKVVHPAVKIQPRKTFNVLDEGAVTEYCKAHLPNAFAVNWGLVEKHAKAVIETAPMPGVEFVDKPIATIGTNLDCWAPVSEPEA